MARRTSTPKIKWLAYTTTLHYCHYNLYYQFGQWGLKSVLK